MHRAPWIMRLICMKLRKNPLFKIQTIHHTDKSKAELGEATGEKRMTGFHAVKRITTRDSRNLDCVWNRGDRRDEGKLVLMRKIEMSAITDHWLQTRVNISKWIVAVLQEKKHTHTRTHAYPYTNQNKLRISLIPLAGFECENRKWHYTHTQSYISVPACSLNGWVGAARLQAAILNHQSCPKLGILHQPRT